jgi:hypothetical protein
MISRSAAITNHDISSVSKASVAWPSGELRIISRRRGLAGDDWKRYVAEPSLELESQFEQLAGEGPGRAVSDSEVGGDRPRVGLIPGELDDDRPEHVSDDQCDVGFDHPVFAARLGVVAQAVDAHGGTVPPR